MSTPHINANKGDFAKVVLMPGDPIRAKWIADTYLHDVKMVSNVRNICGYTGYTKNNKKISVMASGMGHPSIGIYSYELFSKFEVETIIRVGTCGAYQPHINLFDILIASTSSTDSNWAFQYQLNGTFSAGADFDLITRAVNVAKNKNVPVHVGNILSTDVFYNADQNNWKKWAELGILGVEMESYALYCSAAKLKKKALCILTVSDSFLLEEELTSDERAHGLARMIEIAIETAEAVAD
ncbi:MAG TPA: purine-nucleoside phosphorylase [Erysipelotrichaceae bacterium]|nr:purine-nucleoside phosphorylase [Erysipelotrichaceae bacterium]